MTRGQRTAHGTWRSVSRGRGKRNETRSTERGRATRAHRTAPAPCRLPVGRHSLRESLGGRARRRVRRAACVWPARCHAQSAFAEPTTRDSQP
eukprot:5719291-Prymnesium_polylepis.1